jgi:hypothetical protein
MNRKRCKWIVGLGLLTALCAQVGTAQAQTTDTKEKERMYTYVANWTIPRAHWADMEKPNAAEQKVLDQAMSDGTLVAYGSDVNLVHQQDGDTHDSWWSAHSMAGVLNTLDGFYKTGTTTSPVLASATRHSDNIFVTHHYNWHSGSWKGAYTHGSSYKLKPNAPDDAVDILSKNVFEPVLEKLLTDGAIVEYEVDEEAIHTEAPDSFWVFYITQNAEGIDKVNAAIRAALKGNPLLGPSIDSMVDFTPHRDYLERTNATFK